jgi:hypothetical protein
MNGSRNAETMNDAFAREGAPDAPDPVRAKLADAQVPGYQAEFDPAEAEAAGAFPEVALTEADALASTHDCPYFPAVPVPQKS